MKSWKICLCLLLQLWNIFCDASNSQSCRSTEIGIDYNGFANSSTSNKSCKPWSVGHVKYKLDELQIKDFSENFCRNPNNSSSVWCYVDVNTTETCFVPLCLTNPEANYCIPIPTRDFTTCPILFQNVNLFKQNVSKEFQFCCLKDQIFSEYLPITDGCLLSIISTKFLKPKFALCPSGYHHQSILNPLVEDKSIYQCCRYTMVKASSSHKLYKFIDVENINKSISFFGSLTNGSCMPVHDFYTDVVEYFNTIELEYRFLEYGDRLCFYYLNTMTDTAISNSELGILSLTSCPFSFIQSNFTKYLKLTDEIQVKICQPISKDFSYPSGQYCLLQLSQDKLKCPLNFHAYIIRSAVNGEELLRLCCLVNNLTTILWLNQEKDSISENSSIAFVSLTKECPFMISNVSMSYSIVNATIESYSNPRKNQTLSDLNYQKLKLCNYELLIDRFAYKKIGEVCPSGMIDSWLTFTSVFHWEPDLPNEIFRFEYCVGIAILKLDSFPKGNYCLYKIGNICPLGFISSSMPNPKMVINRSLYAPNYTSDAFCCRDDGKKSVLISSESFPFLDKNKTSFGILISNKKDVCPKIGGYIDHHGGNLDGFYCAYRTVQDNYKWSNKIIFPIQTSETIQRFTKRKHWESLLNFQYISSVVLSYPKEQFCIVSGEKCSSMKNIDFAMFYPISKMFLCCSLRKVYISKEFFNLKNYKKYPMIGFVAIHGQCPKVNNEIYTFQNAIEEVFEIEKAKLNSNEIYNFIKLGLKIDVNSKLNFVRITYKFCIYRLSKDQTDSINLFGFIKPLQFGCPIYFSEEVHIISVNRKENFHSIFPYFFKQSNHSNNVYASFCFQRINAKVNKTFLHFKSLCFFSYKICPTGYRAGPNELLSSSESNIEWESLVICCHTDSEMIQKESPSIALDTPFILPLKPGVYECPKIKNFIHEKWKSNKLHLQTIQYMNFCFYHKKVAPISWPNGNYMTIAINNNCPPYFTLLQHKLASLCMRNEINTEQTEFPSGQYCLLSHLGLKCPLPQDENSVTNFIKIEDKFYFICCTQSKEMILNIHIPEKNIFSFLSLDKCSIISDASVITKPFSNFSRIVQCIYISDCFNKSSPNCKESLSIMKDASVNSRMIIIVLLSIIGVVFVVVLGLVLLSKFKNNSLVEHFKLENIFNYTDSGSNRVYSEVEQVPSVTYSTLI